MQVYSGGLGVLAGDHLKAASDLGLHLTGVGLLYRHGYFRQYLDADGWQQERYPDLNPFSLPLQLLERDGAPVLIEVRLAERSVACQLWKAEVAGGLEVVAGQHPEATRIGLHRVADAELG